MALQITKVEIRYEHDIVLARQRARTIAGLLGLGTNEQTRFSTAVSEIARNAFVYAGAGEIEFIVEEKGCPPLLIARVGDRGPGIADVSKVLEGRYQSKTGMGLGIVGVRRLMDYFHIESIPGTGTTVFLGKKIPRSAPAVTPQTLSIIADQLSSQLPQNPFEEIQRQNQELLRTMQELKLRQEELQSLNRELEDTNRGIVALYAELDEKANHLNRANELKASFLSNMSHEFRTPLNAILSLSGLLINRIDGELTEEQEKQVVFIKKAAEDLSALVNDLLDIAKIEAGKVGIHVAEFHVGNLFSALRGMLKPVLANPSVALVFEEPESIPTMCTDEGKVSQILRNLISNAIKFTERGEIRISAKAGDAGKRVTFAVSDTGIGIPAEDLERIFEEYAQVDSPWQRKAKGTGLGLPLSRKLADLLGGVLTVESVLGQGSIFSAVIPTVYGTAEGGEAEETMPVDITRRSLLVVEDDETMIALYAKYLKGSGFQVLSAHTLTEARQIIERTSPTAIILDVLLGGENGWDFLTELKSNDTTRNIPVFVVTVLEDREKSLALGAEDYAIKPLDRKWLLSKLREEAQRGPIEKVLIIDDEEVARYILKSQLADTRYTVIEASGGRDGLRRAEEEQPGIIFLDLMMPDMDGFETLSRLKASPKTEHIPVIIVTSKVLDDEERQILREQAMEILSKESASHEDAVAKIRNVFTGIAERKNAVI